MSVESPARGLKNRHLGATQVKNIFPERTRFANLQPGISYCLIFFILFLIVYTLFTMETVNNDPGKEGADLACQRAIVEGIRNGEGYYETAKKELIERGYATQSVFNWRLPFLAFLFAFLPTIEMGYWLGIMLAATALFLWTQMLKKEKSLGQTLLGSLLFTGFLIYGGIPELFFAHEFWAGICIVLSLIFYSRGWVILSFVAGGGALLIRELSLPFIIIMMMFAFSEKRWRETIVWILLIIGFLSILGIHAHFVKSHMGNVHFIQKGEWIALGGWSFALKTIQLHPFLTLNPPWVNAILIPLLLLGLAGWKGKLGSRIAISVYTYILSFLFVGQPFNIYWGAIFNALVPLGLLYIIPSLKDLWGAISRKPLTYAFPSLRRRGEGTKGLP